MTTRAVILDLDGLLVDSEPIHQRAFNTYLARHGVEYQFAEEEYGRAFVGIPVGANAEYLIERFALPYTAVELLAEREAIYTALIGDPCNLRRMPGVSRLLDELRARKIGAGIASGSPREQVEIILRGLGIAERFPVVVAGTDVPKTKPAPDVYLRAMELLGVSKSDCFAVEDSATGVAAAKAAGLRVIAVPNRYTQQQDLSRADAQVKSLEHVIPLLG
ncbi:MAG: HAD family phosphatase [Chloroflexi bacterium]|nr:HAD family phosphatase [Chloroflexota bacterium]